MQKLIAGMEMQYEERMERLKNGHKALMGKLNEWSLKQLPENVDREKLERAYDKIENEYVLVLKKKSELK